MKLDSLQELAFSRRIPDFFEHAYEERTGVNPVAAALRLQFNSAQGRKAIQGLILLSASFAILLFSSGIGQLNATTKALFIVLFFVCLGVGSYNLLTGLYAHKPVLANTFDLVHQFCRDLTLFEGTEGGIPLDEFDGDDGKKRAREHAQSLLVIRAWRRQEGEITQNEFRQYYDAMDRLGLVSGGYDKLFRAAAARKKIGPASWTV